MNYDELTTKYLTNVASSSVCKYLDFIAVFGHGRLIINELDVSEEAAVVWFNALPIPGNELEVSLYRNCLSALVPVLNKGVINYPEVFKALKTYFVISLGSDSPVPTEG